MIKTFLAGAFLGAGAFGALTHGAWTSTLHTSSLIPALTVADLIEDGGALAAGVLALLVVARQDRRRPARP
ncbi:MAG: hypothetical protein JO303_15435 [Caulobacteraceae bacterium]|nr:hypothetical protein [Caulobacteraceae bacterium]